MAAGSFEVRALDRRSTDEGLEVAYQLARSADVDLESPGGDLVVRLVSGDAGVPVLSGVQPLSPVFTPNQDGVHDRFVLNYSLLKLFSPVSVFLDIYSLDGHLMRSWEDRLGNGHHALFWDGGDADGQLVPPGLYLYELRVIADESTARHHGVVGVAY